MKYDRPVWQIMHECADAMPAVFRYEDVRSWFKAYYPDVNEATIRAHLIGLTEGGRAKHVQFAPRSPVFRRVARGEYESIPLHERGEDPHAAAPGPRRLAMSLAGDRAVAQAREGAVESAPADDGAHEQLVPHVVLLGSVGERVNVPAPAKEVYRDVSFQLARLEAESSGADWFVLSAEHGLVAPHEWISPDSRTLDELDPGYRVVWASWVVTRLQSLVGSLDGMVVRVDAPAAVIGPLYADLQATGAVVSSGPVVSLAPLEPDTWDEEAADLAPVTAIEPSSPVGAHLSDPRQATPSTDLELLPRTPGLYGWVVDADGARVLNRCLRLPVAAGLVFVGQVGGSSWHSLVDPVLNLRDHIQTVQLHGRTRASTFRMTLATVLSDHLGMTSVDDPVLTTWMLEHLSVSTWAVPDGEGLRELAQLLVAELDPPLNVDHLPATEYRSRLQQMRTALA
ncbi:DUF7669 domain-containing protein [Aeromicrobium wangtongii]|uniref:DUF7669 domain-containing protein n=1 Tax=Aeromicrobium wangtongii TaxID=2969247 RepID=UPI0020181458|nr:DUF6884 domain-containing protein [Aeromicrobium wangtongii]MCL3819007.1 hypothetical protein [Aeromicrobium wangtongii]